MNHFQHLPDEIINKIYSYLDAESIKFFSLTFKRSANVLASSSHLLNKHFKLKLDGDFWTNKEKVLEVLMLKRFLNEIDISNVAGNHNVLNAIFQKYGCQVVKLKISSSKIDDFTLREVLKLCPILKEIQLSEVKVIKKLPLINPVCMTELKKVSVVYCDWEIFKFLSRSQINSLTIKSYLDEGNNRKDLVRFLTFQRKLIELTLHGTSLRTLFQNQDVNEDCFFSLETLRVDNGIGKNSDIVNMNIISFINKMDESLQHVEICGPHNEDLAVYTLLYLENVRNLVIDVRGLPKNSEFYQQLSNTPRNINLESLNLCGFFFHQEAIKSILLKYPMIRELEIYDWGNGPISNLLDFISQNLIYLQKLKITEITNNENIKLNALQNLSVQYIRNARKLFNFIVKNNSVETLNIGLVYIGQVSEFANDLDDLNNVKHLSVGGNKTALKKILNLIRMKTPKKLETLELSLVTEEKNASQKTIKINLPFDPMDLNLKFNILI